MRNFLAALVAVLCFATQQLAAHAETRVALVIGNSAYQTTAPLTNPLNDAHDISAVLKGVGFQVVEALDADKRKLDGALRAFADQLSNADVALLFYAGHGLQVGGENYLIPVDAKLTTERDLEFEAIKLDFILRQMEIDREGKTTLVFLDACRDNPLSRNLARSMGTRSAGIGRGLAAASPGVGTFIAYSTQPGNVALDGSGRNSPFASALLKHIGAKGRNLPATMIEVRKEVLAATGGKQVTWDHAAMTGDFYFVPGGAEPQAGSIAAAPQGTSVDVAALQERLRKLEEDAKKRDERSAQPPVAALPAGVPGIAPKDGSVAGQPTTQIDDNVRIDGLKISDKRQPNPEACRASCEREPNCVAFQHGRRSPMMGQCHLFARVDARQEDANWRSGVRENGASGSEKQGHVKREPITFEAPISRRDKGFEVYDGIALMGTAIKMSAADSPAGCQLVCRNTPGCRIATYNDFFRGKNVACLIYGEKSDAIPTPSASTMVVTSP